MKLFDVFLSRDSWTKLLRADMPPKLAYELLKYSKAVTTELSSIEQQRNKLIRKAAGIEDEQQPVSLTPGTPEFDTFARDFDDFLDVYPDMMVFPKTLGQVVESIDGKVLSPEDLRLLEPFFTH